MFRTAVILLLLPFVSAEVLIGSLNTRSHLVSGEVYAISERVLEVRNFAFDGGGPAPYWWIDTSAIPSRGGIAVDSPENQPSCGHNIGKAFDGTNTVTVELPSGMSVSDFAGGSLSVWCEAFDANFGEVAIPATLTGIRAADSVALQCSADVDDTGSSIPDIAQTPEGFNCERLNDDFQVRWQVVDSNLLIDLVGRVEDGTYMAFGRSGSDAFTQMLGGDVVVADFNGEFRARDLYLSAQAQCTNGTGVCPDSLFSFVDDITEVSGSSEFGLTQVRFTRPLVPSDVQVLADGGTFFVDRAITTDAAIETIWALGPVNPNNDFPSFHSSRGGVSIHFGRDVVDNCEPLVGGAEEDAVLAEPFVRPVSSADTTEIFATIGPSGGERGYKSISGGRAAWGIAWYLNGVLVPEIEMRRGTTYKIHVNGGTDPASPSEYHPMYLTSSIAGGYSGLTPEERMEETVFAGLDLSAETVSRQTFDGFGVTAFGPICRYETTAATQTAFDDLVGYEEYIATVDTTCSADTTITGNAGLLEFTPDDSTPDLIYYQCVTHQNLGWKIRILNADGTSNEGMSNEGMSNEGMSDDGSSGAFAIGNIVALVAASVPILFV